MTGSSAGDEHYADQGDRLRRLWTPHRLDYVVGAAKKSVGAAPRSPVHTDQSSQPDGCPFCDAINQTEEDSLIIAKGNEVYAILNLYPYNPGHLMILPYRHIGDYTDLTVTETAELAHFTQKAMQVIHDVSNPHGFNIGINQGAVAGGGLSAHLHQHLVPRWGGDTNFMTVIAQTKVLPQLLVDTKRLLASAWQG